MLIYIVGQGAQVSADVACGNTEKGFPATEALSKSVSDKSKASHIR
jgi:hypothetical protein